MKKEELRIGNCVLFDDKMDSIMALGTSMAAGVNHSHWYYERLKPIPLTPAILEDLGFEFNGNEYTYPSDGDLVFTLKNGTLIPNPNYTGQAFSSDKAYPKFLHQLQNLIFALTGEELILKSKTETGEAIDKTKI